MAEVTCGLNLPAAFRPQRFPQLRVAEQGVQGLGEGLRLAGATSIRNPQLASNSSGMSPTFDATTGRAHASASITTNGTPSLLDTRITTSEAA